MGKVSVKVISASNLQHKDWFGHTSPYVKVMLQQEIKETKVDKNNVNPVWEEQFVMELPHTENINQFPLIFEVWDHERLEHNKHLGRAEVALGTLQRGVPTPLDLQLEDAKSGVLTVEILAEDFGLEQGHHHH